MVGEGERLIVRNVDCIGILYNLVVGVRKNNNDQSKTLTWYTIGRVMTRDALRTFASVGDDLAFVRIKCVNRCTACTWPFGT